VDRDEKKRKKEIAGVASSFPPKAVKEKRRLGLISRSEGMAKKSIERMRGSESKKKRLGHGRIKYTNCSKQNGT